VSRPPLHLERGQLTSTRQALIDPVQQGPALARALTGCISAAIPGLSGVCEPGLTRRSG